MTDQPGTGDALLASIKASDLDPESCYVWGGAESRILTTIRRHLRDEKAFEREQVSLIAYWRKES